MLTEQEQQQLLVEFNQPRVDFGNNGCIQQRFEHHAKINPNAIALSLQGQQLSYGELNRQANRLAHYLINQHQVKPDTLVGLCSERSMEMVIAILAILKAGGAYVPLDPGYPLERLNYMVQDAGLRLILKHGAALEVAATQLEITTLMTDMVASPHHNPTVAELTADNLAYVIYTSGSTGQPKGVMTPHKAIQRLITEPHFMTLNDQTVFLHSANIAFDAATIELWGPLLNGGRCVLYPSHYVDLAELNSVITREQVNSMWLTAGLFSEWSQNCGAATCLRYVLAGGDVVHSVDVIRVQQALSGVTVINGYGPTENTTFSCCYVIPKLTQSQNIPIGKILNGDQALLLDQQLNLVPYGCVGELCVGGDGLARGYLNQPEMTAERFIDNPYHDAANPDSANCLYRTGDLVRYLADGSLAFIGRVDDQIKIRGFRIELGEIEHKLSLQTKIDSGLVMAKDGPGGKYLVAYFKPVSNCEQAQQGEFIEQALTCLASDLPDYMVPDLGVVVNDWPLTANGKIDRKALPEEDADQLLGKYVAPANEIEVQLCEIWLQLLNRPVETLSTQAHFFDIGGNSLLLVRLATLIREHFAIEFEIKELYSATRICDQALHIEYLVVKSESAKQDEDYEELEW
jgi:amino acid adenylation domain-containing protein